jgi:hypothetical protein
MQKIHPPNEEIGDSDKNQIGVIDDRTGIPGKNENAEGDGDAEGFRDAVKEEKIVKARQVEPQEEKACVNEIREEGRSFCDSFHRDPWKNSSEFRVRSSE